MAETDQERTEQATPKKRQDARRKGNVAKSQDVVAAASLLGAVILLTFAAKSAGVGAVDFMRSSFAQNFVLQTDAAAFASTLSNLILRVFSKLILFFLVVVATSVAANLLQTGILILPDKIAPKLSRINPFKNFAKLFSFATLGQLFFACFKIFVLALALVLSMRRDFETIVSLPNGDIVPILLFTGSFLKRLAFLLCGTLLALAALDYVVKRIAWERSLKMTPQELKEEIKEESGNPQAKGKRAAMRRSALDSISAVAPPRPTTPTSRYQERKQQDKSAKSR
ncbi:MAG: EscU/YscU/HrcU family type III secretion system export apparatus switch protein [Thermoguttaceae bacterium]|nr:EscU/YscU/HrcU family type III secretion system export apparatus switch protein [Thermoguttaceae bacterium]